MDEASLCVIQDEKCEYVYFAMPPALLFDLKKDPNQFNNVVDHPDYQRIALAYAQKMLSWRLVHADRSLTDFRSAMHGLEERNWTEIKGHTKTNTGVRT